MAQSLHILIDPPLDGPENMARDEHLLHSESLRPAVLRIYRWDSPTISLGYFQAYAGLSQLPPELRALAVVRRTTGGGAILHDCEVTYCLVVDDSLDVARQAPEALYRLAHECWGQALAASGVPAELAPESLPMPSPRSGPFFCFEKPGRTDLLLGGDKLLGSAQRRTAGAVLQHGSLLLGRRFGPHPGADLGAPATETVDVWISTFLDALATRLRLPGRSTSWTAAQLADVARRRRRYASDEWTQKR